MSESEWLHGFQSGSQVPRYRGNIMLFWVYGFSFWIHWLATIGVAESTGFDMRGMS